MLSSAKRYVTRAGGRAHLLWLVHTRPGISRAELADESGLSKAAISAGVTDLLKQGWLLEAGAIPSGAGRRRMGLQLNQHAGLALGAELSPDHVTVVLTDMAGQCLQSDSRALSNAAPNDAVRQTAALVKTMLKSRLFSEAASGPASEHVSKRLLGLGMGVPGLVDAAGQAVFLFTPNAWAGELPLAALLREQLAWPEDIPITLINTGQAGALGEYRSGAGQEADDMLFISAGDTIDAGLVLDGRLYLGGSGGAGDVAHIVIDPSGPACTCGNAGCLEALAGGLAVVGMVITALKEQGRDHLLMHLQRPWASIALPDVIEAALSGDLAALAAVRQAGEYLGLALAGLVNALNLRRVLVGGKLAESGDVLMAPLRQAILRRSTPAAYSSVEVVPAALGQDAVAIGAAAVAIDRYLLMYK